MNMIHQIQSAPHHIRRNIVVGISGSVTFVLMMFWLSTLSVFQQGTVLAPLNVEGDNKILIVRDTKDGKESIVSDTGSNTKGTVATAWQGVKGLTASVFRSYRAFFSNSQTYTATPYIDVEVVATPNSR